MTSLSLRTSLFAAVAALLVAPPGHADSVSGHFELDGKSLAPTEVAAFRVRDQFNAREFTTYVMLTTQPVDREAIAKDTDPYTTAINDEAVRDADYLSFHVDAGGTASMNAHVGGTQYIDSSGKIMGATGGLVATCSTNTPERVACNVKSAKPVKTMDGEAWTVDVSFDSAVLSRAPGKPLPKDGGEPGKVFLGLVEAAKGNDLGKIVALLAPSEAEDYQRDYNTPEENLASAKQMFEFTLPKQPKITGGELPDADTALLEVEGVPYEGSRVLYIVTLQRTGGRWGYLSSNQAGMLR
jgi:hypothetical protein